MRELELNAEKFDFILDSLGHTEIPIEQRAFTMCKILHELKIPFRKYYTSPKHRYLRTKPYFKENDFSDMGVVLIGTCNVSYANYAIYLYNKKMTVIKQLNNMLL